MIIRERDEALAKLTGFYCGFGFYAVWERQLAKQESDVTPDRCWKLFL
jgi:hypothetical protein